MKIAIVILNWNGKRLLEQFLPSVLAHVEGLAEIYVADNASTDDSIDYLKTNFPQVKIVINTQNYGFALGYNKALEEVTADVFCLLNNDVAVTKNWLNTIRSTFEAEPNTAIVQPKILNYNQKGLFDYAGAAGGFIDRYGFPYCRGRIFNTIEVDQGQYNGKQDIFWASGACFFIRREVFNQLQGFDADFFAHMEEIDLCWRAQNLGHSIKFVPESVVYHIGGATLDSSNPRKTYLNFRNSLFTLAKNAPRPIFARLLTRLLLDGLAGLKFLLELKPLHTVAVIKAHVHFYFKLSHLLNKRKSIPKVKKYYHTRSIVWQYFVNRKRTFNSL